MTSLNELYLLRVQNLQSFLLQPHVGRFLPPQLNDIPLKRNQICKKRSLYSHFTRDSGKTQKVYIRENSGF
jgi:hypothetical protein